MNEIVKVGEDVLFGNRLGFYRPKCGKFEMAMHVVNLTDWRIMGTSRCVKARVEELGNKFIIEVYWNFKKLRLKRRDVRRSEAECAATLIQIGLGGSVKLLTPPFLIHSCLTNARKARTLWLQDE